MIFNRGSREAQFHLGLDACQSSINTAELIFCYLNFIKNGNFKRNFRQNFLLISQNAIRCEQNLIILMKDLKAPLDSIKTAYSELRQKLMQLFLPMINHRSGADDEKMMLHPFGIGLKEIANSR